MAWKHVWALQILFIHASFFSNDMNSWTFKYLYIADYLKYYNERILEVHSFCHVTIYKVFFTFSACTSEGLKRRLFQLLLFFFYLYLVGTEAEAQILYASVYMKL